MSKILRLEMVSAQRKNQGKNKRIENNEPPTSAIPGASEAGSFFAILGTFARFSGNHCASYGKMEAN